MNYVEMTREEWEEVCRRHDALVHMEELALQAEEIRASRSSKASRHVMKPVELQLQELDDIIASLPR